MLSARLLQTYFAAKILVSRLVAIIGPAFRSLWRKSDMPGRQRSAVGSLHPKLQARGPCRPHRRRAGEGDPEQIMPWRSPPVTTFPQSVSQPLAVGAAKERLRDLV
jgi:hypothetical protein